MGYVVQQNYNPAHNYLSVHRSNCVHAREPGRKTLNTEWFGPFDDYRAASSFAEHRASLTGATIKDCSFCTPR